jgi:hypothetical protein
MTPRLPLPARRPNFTRAIDWAGHPITVTVGLRVDGSPAEVFADSARGGDMAATLADACVLISIALQHGIAPADLAKSLGRVPLLRAPGGQVEDARQDAPASPIGAIVEVVVEEGWVG